MGTRPPVVLIPALLIRIVSFPHSSTIRSTARSICPERLTSPSMASASPPDSRIPPDCFFRPLKIDIHNGHVSAVGCQQLGNGLPDAPGPPGDQGHLMLEIDVQSSHPRVSGFRNWFPFLTSNQASITAGQGRTHSRLQTSSRAPGADGPLDAQLRKTGPTLRKWSGQRDLNPRLPAPKAGALPDCAMPRHDRELENITRRSGLCRHAPLWIVRLG